MIYTTLTRKVLSICFDAHKDQRDKSGAPYVFHPFHLAEQMTDEYTVCTALLHDVVEDTDTTLEDLRSEGFPEEVLEALALLTHDADTPYMDYVKRLKHNPIARAVKLADLAHNSDPTRLEVMDEWALARAEKYHEAIKLLSE